MDQAVCSAKCHFMVNNLYRILTDLPKNVSFFTEKIFFVEPFTDGRPTWGPDVSFGVKHVKPTCQIHTDISDGSDSDGFEVAP